MLQETQHFIGWHSPGKKPPLDLRGPQSPYGLHLWQAFHPFYHCIHAKSLGQFKYRAKHMLLPARTQQAIGKAFVYFQFIELISVQIAHAGIARSKIIQSQAESRPPEFCEQATHFIVQ